MPLDKNTSKNTSKNEYMQLALTIFAEVTGWIVFPIIGALYLGKWLDEKQGTEPLYFLSITAVAFIISSVGIGITGVKYMKKIDQAESLKQEHRKEILKKKDENESRDK